VTTNYQSVPSFRVQNMANNHRTAANFDDRMTQLNSAHIESQLYEHFEMEIISESISLTLNKVSLACRRNSEYIIKMA
jgi:hypothetical protein